MNVSKLKMAEHMLNMHILQEKIAQNTGIMFLKKQMME